MRHRLLLVAVLFWAAFSFAQSSGGNKSTASAASFTFTGVLASIPATCTVGQLAFITNATAGQNIYECTATNTWTQQLNSGAGGASVALDNLLAPSINTALLFQSGKDIGSTLKPARDLFLVGSGTFGTNYFRFTGTPTSTRVLTLPDATTTLSGIDTADILTNKTLTTPTIGSFVNATHNHGNAAGGGTLAFGTALSDISGAVVTSGSSVTTPGKIDVLNASQFCQAAGASSTTYTCNLSPAITAYVTGTHYRFKADVANTAASTINFNAQGAKTIKKAAGGITTDLVANDLQAGQWADLVYDGTNMQMQSTLGNASSGASTPCTTTALSVQFNNAGAFGCLSNFTYNSTTGQFTASQKADTNETFYGKRFTDTTPTGNLFHFQNAAANSDIFKLDVNGNATFLGTVTAGPLISPTANPASAGSLRLANNTDKIEWNNAAGNANLAIYFDASNVFQIPGTLNVGSLTTGGTGADVYTAVADPAASLGEFWLSSTLTGRWKYSDASAIHTIVGADSTDTLTNKTYDTAGTGNSFSINGVAATANTGTGAVARAAGPTFTTPTLGVASATSLATTTAGAGAFITTAGTAQGHATASTVTLEAPAAVTAYEILLPAAAGTGLAHYSNAASVVTETISAVTSADATGNTSGSGNFCLVTSCVMTTPNVTTIKDANANPFILSSATTSAVDSITITNAATANPATVTIAGSGTDTNINTAINAKGSGTVNASTFFQATSNRVAMTADWTCGTSSVSTSCTAATIVGTNGTPLTLTLPLQAQSWHLHCEGVVGQATAATSNQWNLLTATNGATNVTATYKMATAATVSAYGAVTDQAATTTTFQIAPNWTLGGTATKMPFSIDASIEGASASGTVVSLQLLAPTAADVVTIYRGAFCSVSSF